MFRFKEYLAEIKAPEVNISTRLLKTMSSDAQRAISSWEYFNWRTGDLETAYRTKSQLWKEIESNAETIRSAIKKQHGNQLVLYRGIENGGSGSKAKIVNMD